MRSSFVDVRSELYARHSAAVRRFVRSLGISREDREDLVQQTFMMACRKNVKIPRTPAAQLDWLCSSALRLHEEQEQEAEHRAAAFAEHAAIAAPHVPSPHEQISAREQLDKASTGLTPEERSLVLQNLLECKTIDELSPDLEIGRSAVWARIKKLRSRMRAALVSLQWPTWRPSSASRSRSST
jgi:RNA polymerase sigma factor (sigma-70 family)